MFIEKNEISYGILCQKIITFSKSIINFAGLLHNVNTEFLIQHKFVAYSKFFFENLEAKLFEVSGLRQLLIIVLNKLKAFNTIKRNSRATYSKLLRIYNEINFYYLISKLNGSKKSENCNF